MATTVTYSLATTKAEFTTNTQTTFNQFAPCTIGLSGGEFACA